MNNLCEEVVVTMVRAYFYPKNTFDAVAVPVKMEIVNRHNRQTKFELGHLDGRIFRVKNGTYDYIFDFSSNDSIHQEAINRFFNSLNNKDFYQNGKFINGKVMIVVSREARLPYNDPYFIYYTNRDSEPIDAPN